MLKESSKNQNEKEYSEIRNFKKENIICKDGFCSLPNYKDITKQDKNKINLFDPI